jgi:hypothetical protein
MKLSGTSMAACLVLFVTASAAFGQPCPYRPGSPPNWCAAALDGARGYYPAPGPSANPSDTANHRYRYGVPRAPADPYSAPPSGGRVPPTYATPTIPANPYTPSPNYPSVPAATSYPAQIPFSAANPYASAAGAFSYKCVINDVGDFCTGTANSPASAGAGCTCGGRYSGYVE